jgi:hypothetical protein
MANKKWSELEPRQRRAIILTGTVQAGLALTAWYDLSHRSQEQVNGPKLLWALAIAINFVGPIAYFRFGRTHHLVHKATPWHEKVHLETTELTH